MIGIAATISHHTTALPISTIIRLTRLQPIEPANVRGRRYFFLLPIFLGLNAPRPNNGMFTVVSNKFSGKLVTSKPS